MSQERHGGTIASLPTLVFNVDSTVEVC